MNHLGVPYFSDYEFQKKRFLKFSQKHNLNKQFKKALTLAEKYHKGQFRYGSDCVYVIHPVRVANILIYEAKNKDTNTITAALLHDTVEDTDLTLTDIASEFNRDIMKLVKSLTRQRSSQETEKEKAKNKIRKFKEISLANYEVRLVKCADLLDNIRDWSLFSEDYLIKKKFPRWLKETKSYAIPLAQKTDATIAASMQKALSLFA